jgi:hypothetical protein
VGFLTIYLEAISKMQITLKDKARADPPSLKSYGGTGEKAESAGVRWQIKCIFEIASNKPISFY